MLTVVLSERSIHLTHLVLTLVTALLCLIAIWAAKSRRHWFWRAAIVCGAVLLLVPIRAYGPAFTFALALPTIVVILRVGPLRRERYEAQAMTSTPAAVPRGAFQFRLQSLMLFTLLTGIVLSGLIAIDPHVSLDQALFSLCCAAAIVLISTLTYTAVTSKRHWLWIAALAIAIPCSAFLVWSVGNSDRSRGMGGVMYDSVYMDSDIPILMLGLSELSIALAVGIGLQRYFGGTESTSQKRRLRFAAYVIIAVSFAILYWQMLYLTPIPPPFENPNNHYAEIVKLSDELLAKNPAYPTLATLCQSGGPTAKADAQELADLHAVILSHLNGTNAVVLDFDGQIDVTNLSEGSRLGYSLGVLLCNECEEAFTVANSDRGVEYSLALLRLSSLLSRGGLTTESHWATFAESVALNYLTQFREQLPASSLPRILAAFERLEEEREPIAAKQARTRAHDERVYGWSARLDSIIGNFCTKPDDTYRSSYYESKLGMLRCDIAIRLFRHQHNRLPESLSELAPEHLPDVPADPFSGQPFIYRAMNDAYLLYSVGPDRQDNGGTFGSLHDVVFTKDGFDEDLDTGTREDSSSTASVSPSSTQPPAAKP